MWPVRFDLDLGEEYPLPTAVLFHRPYQLPVVVNGVRIYIEATHRWATEAELASLPGLAKAVRFSALDAGEPWGPQDLVFPVRAFRWRSSPYNNTSSSKEKP